MAVYLYQILDLRVISEHRVLRNYGQIYHQLSVRLKRL